MHYVAVLNRRRRLKVQYTNADTTRGESLVERIPQQVGNRKLSSKTQAIK
jgi:hypothetical protein